MTVKERFSSSPMYFGLMIFSTMALMIINPATTIIASVNPSSARARKAGGITLRIKPILGTKLNKNDKKAHKNGKSTPIISRSTRLPRAVRKPVKAEIDTYRRTSSASSATLSRPFSIFFSPLYILYCRSAESIMINMTNRKTTAKLLNVVIKPEINSVAKRINSSGL